MKLIKPDERVKSLAQTLKIGIFQCEPEIDGRIIFINHIGAKILGVNNPDEVIGDRLSNFFANPAEFEKIVDQVKKKDIDKEFEAVCKRRDGNDLFVSITLSLVKDEKDNNIRIDGTIRDIQKNKEDEIEKEIVANINRLLISNLDIREVYQKVCEELSRKIRWDRVSVVLFEEKEKGIENIDFAVTKGDKKGAVATEFPEKGRHPFIGSILEKLVISGKPFIVKDTTENIVETDKIFAKDGLRSRLAYPLRLKNKIIGGLTFSNKEVNYYNEGHTRLLDKVGSLLAIAIDHTKLFIRATKSEREYERLFKTIDSAWL